MGEPTAQLRDRLEQLHDERAAGAGGGNVFVEVLLPDGDGEGEPNIQYQIGVLNLASLDPEQKQRALELFEAGDFSIQSDFEQAVTAFDDSMSPTDAFEYIDRVLRTVYDLQWDDVVGVREREL